MSSLHLNAIPDGCTLPTAEQPLRIAEFDALFSSAVRAVARPAPDHVRLSLTGGADLAATVRDLTERESTCCSFFHFTVTRAAALSAGSAP